MRVVTGLILVVIGLSGCGPTCQSTCSKIFLSENNGCEIQKAYSSNQSDLFDECVQDCEYALAQVGEMGDYNPDEPIRDGSSVSLDNEQQAAAWMDCVEETSCPLLDDGYCAPI